MNTPKVALWLLAASVPATAIAQEIPPAQPAQIHLPAASPAARPGEAPQTGLAPEESPESAQTQACAATAADDGFGQNDQPDVVEDAGSAAAETGGAIAGGAVAGPIGAAVGGVLVGHASRAIKKIVGGGKDKKNAKQERVTEAC
jgi:hypothetical protein